MPIHILPEVVASQIAAGEVVERPASVVKELIENALDAGAHNIRVEVEAGGRRLIRITDDGCGIPGAESELAFERHATSKLLTVDDLQHIQTLGFRGEALASIASVAQVTLLTLTAAETAGTLLRMEGGRLLDHRAAGTPVGTVITVENLFFNTPARLKFLKAETTERRHIDMVVTRYAMAYPNVRFTLVQDGRVTFTSDGTGDLADVLIEVLGVETMHEMLPVNPVDSGRADLPNITVYGYTSAPHVNRNTRSHITLFVNGRHIQDTGLTFAVCQAYHTLMPADRYPIAVLMITLPPEDVDVNVHPAKSEVRFRSADAVFSAVQRAVRRAVTDDPSIPSATPPRTLDDILSMRPQSTPTAEPFDFPAFDAGRRSQQIGPINPPMPIEAERSVETSVPNTPSVDLTQRPRTLPPLRVVGQIGAMYIVAEGPAGMYLVDQHAAHERILFELFMLEQANRPTVTQQTLDSVAVELPAASARLLEEHLESLQAIGFDIEPFGGNTFRVRAIPALFANRLPQDAITAILDDLDAGAELGASTLEKTILLRVCKAAAVKAGQVLSYDEMQTLLRQLERCATPRTCPHGRPTIFHMSSDDLAKAFKRK
ncbi:MAG: DNA mismatch repair endonuclease MutL [Anaerolineae bacterium]|nr:DNA mismatch repair endonuclease MutL [Anaerolineae bacterium]